MHAGKLGAAGVPAPVLLVVAEKLLRKINMGPQKQKVWSNKRPRVIPHIHKASHSMKKIAVVFSVSSKMSQLWPRVVDREGKANKCNVNHRNKYIKYAGEVVYRIPSIARLVVVSMTEPMNIHCHCDQTSEAIFLYSVSHASVNLNLTASQFLGGGWQNLREAYEIGKGEKNVSVKPRFIYIWKK